MQESAGAWYCGSAPPEKEGVPPAAAMLPFLVTLIGTLTVGKETAVAIGAGARLQVVQADLALHMGGKRDEAGHVWATKQG